MKKCLAKKAIFIFGSLSILLLILAGNLVNAQSRPKSLSLKTVEYTSRDLRDPFKSPFEMAKGELPESTMGAGLSHLKVQGMVWNSVMPQAIINNTVIKIGELIEGAEILDIRKEGIYVLYEGRLYILRPTFGK